MKADVKKNEEKKGLNPKRIFLYTLGAGVLIGGAWLTYDYLKRKKGESDSEENNYDNTTNSSYMLPSGRNTSSVPRIDMSSDLGFPLKLGSKGENVRQLQLALEKVLGSALLKKYTPIDGIFGSGTQSALKLAGYPVEIDQSTFQTIVSAKGKAESLYEFVQSKNLSGIVSMLSQMKTVSDYSTINEDYKNVSEQKSGTTKTIVTDLLTIAFPDNGLAINVMPRAVIAKEFTRIGLKYDSGSGKWSLSGFTPYRDIITLQITIVIDGQGRKIPVKGNTILGSEVSVKNGETYFKTIDGAVCHVPSRDVAYVK